MRRTKEWWARLTPRERIRLVYLEKAGNELGGGSAYLPDDCGECPSCSSPSLGYGLCRFCLDELIALRAKGDGCGA